MLSAPMDLGPVGAQAHGSNPGRLQASSKTVNSVVTTGSNNWYREPMIRKKLNPIKNLASHMAGAPRYVTKQEIVEV
jgi:hypothetical protein